MRKFEYLITSGAVPNFSDLTEVLDNYGSKGWELVSWNLEYKEGKYLPYEYTNATFKRLKNE